MQTDPPIQELMDFVGEAVREDATQNIVLQFDLSVSQHSTVRLHELSDHRINLQDRLWVRMHDEGVEIYVEGKAWELHFFLAAVRRYRDEPVVNAYANDPFRDLPNLREVVRRLSIAEDNAISAHHRLDDLRLSSPKKRRGFGFFS